MEKPLNIAIIGAGLAGLTAAFATAKQGHNITICAPKPNLQDGRSTALMSGSIDFLTKLDIWESIKPKAFPLKTMRIIDDTNRLIRAPQTDFISSEINLDAFGYNVLNSDLLKALLAQLHAFKSVKFIEKTVLNIVTENQNAAQIIFNDKTQISADLVIAADGRNSPTRNFLKIDARKWQYPQIALVANFEHTLAHNDTSTEFHTPTGPFTLVPLSNKQSNKHMSSFVCVENEEGAKRLGELTSQNLELELEKRMHSILGKINLTSKMQSFPLSSLIANKFSAQNIVLVGEAAHAFPPIGAQGLNLGMRDIEAVSKLLTKKLSPFDIAAEYHTVRKLDINTRTTSVDLLNRSLLSEFLPVQITRSLGLYTLANFGPLRRFAMNEGIAPGRFFANTLASFSKTKPSK